MEPRLLSRTHYQVDEPALAEIVVARCTSPVVSAYDRTVAERLAQDIRGRGKRFNVAAAGYAVDLAHGLRLTNANNVWSDNGHLMNLVAQVGDGQWLDELPLTPGERFMHFRLFLEADGAALLFLSNILASEGQLPAEETDWNILARDMFMSAYSDYLAVTSPTADRVSLRTKLDRLRTRGYNGKSGTHQMFLHLQTLHRLNLVDRVDCSGGRQYRVSTEGQARLRRLASAIPDVLALERVVTQHRYMEIAAGVYGLGVAHEMSPSDALRELLPFYRKVVGTGVAICPLAPVIEAAQMSLLSTRSRLVEYSRFVELLREAQSQHVREIRFHQDRRGNPAFLRLSDGLVSELAAAH